LMSAPRVKIDYQLWNHRDKLGRPRCRYCGRLLIRNQRAYCSSLCYAKFERAINWVSVRHEVWSRDNQVCLRCGKLVFLHGKAPIAEVHHIIPVIMLKRLAEEALAYFDTSDPIILERVYQKILVILYLDRNNLRTLCAECHNVEHREMPPFGPYEGKHLNDWAQFWEISELRQPPLSYFIKA